MSNNKEMEMIMIAILIIMGAIFWYISLPLIAIYGAYKLHKKYRAKHPKKAKPKIVKVREDHLHRLVRRVESL